MSFEKNIIENVEGKRLRRYGFVKRIKYGRPQRQGRPRIRLKGADGEDCLISGWMGWEEEWTERTAQRRNNGQTKVEE